MDTQARKGAWRIGQNEAVTIYRPISTGTNLLTNRVLVDLYGDRHIFNSSDLFDLFSLNEAKSNPEAANTF
nr:unnamed protein product [Callosobruchus analis]